MQCADGFTAMKPSRTPLTSDKPKELAGKALFLDHCIKQSDAYDPTFLAI